MFLSCSPDSTANFKTTNPECPGIFIQIALDISDPVKESWSKCDNYILQFMGKLHGLRTVITLLTMCLPCPFIQLLSKLYPDFVQIFLETQFIPILS